MINKVVITTDCLCDLGEDMLKNLCVPAIFFHIIVDSGNFRDIQEITAQNIIDYISEEHRQLKTEAPSAQEFREFFNYHHTEGSELIHISASSDLSLAYRNACEAAKDMENIYIFDSQQISTGIGLEVIRAVQLVQEGMSAAEILTDLENYRDRISVSFMSINGDYLFRNGKVTKFVKAACDFLHLRPIFSLKNGRLEADGFKMGSYEFCCRSYVRSNLGNINNVNRERTFLTCAGCSAETIENIIDEIKKRSDFKNTHIAKASATTTCNCGPGSFGIVIVRK